MRAKIASQVWQVESIADWAMMLCEREIEEATPTTFQGEFWARVTFPVEERVLSVRDSVMERLSVWEKGL